MHTRSLKRVHTRPPTISCFQDGVNDYADKLQSTVSVRLMSMITLPLRWRKLSFNVPSMGSTRLTTVPLRLLSLSNMVLFHLRPQHMCNSNQNKMLTSTA